MHSSNRLPGQQLLNSIVGTVVVLSANLFQPATWAVSDADMTIFIAPQPEVGYVEIQVPTLPGLDAPTPYLPLPEPLPSLQSSSIRLVLKLNERRVYVYQDEVVLASYPVAVGRTDTPTPTGQFEVFQMIENPIWQSPWTGEVRSPGASSALGLRWIGFAEMPAGIVGFHGTPTVSSIGHAASNGCVRMRNEDVVELFNQVNIGTPVVVEP